MKLRKKCHLLNKIKKYLLILLLIIGLESPSLLWHVQAKSNRFKSLDITVELLDNGDAWVSEVWILQLNMNQVKHLIV